MSKGLLACLQTIRGFLLDFLFPASCLGCKREGTFLCTDCFEKIPRQSEQVCPLCYRSQVCGEVCKNCLAQRKDFALNGVLAVAVFEEKSLLQRAIHDLKYNFVEELAIPLGKLFLEPLQKFPHKNIVLCPVPLHEKRRRWRGFNQAEMLAEVVRKTELLSVHNLLTRITFQKPQMELSRQERIKNVTDAFFIDTKVLIKLQPLPDCVFIVDDVATTLSTINACASVLKKAGIKKVYGLVLARVYL